MPKKKRIRVKRSAPRKVKIRRVSKRIKRIKIRRKKPIRKVRVKFLPRPKQKAPRKKIRIVKRKRIAEKLGKRIGKRLGKIIKKQREKTVKVKRPVKGTANRPQEWLVSFVYVATGRSVDFIAVAFDAAQALKFVRAELRKTDAGRRMLVNFTPHVYAYDPPHHRSIEDVGEVIER